jgi:hypothetical protein
MRAFSRVAKPDAGYQVDQVQRGKQPANFESMPSIGRGVEEIRVSQGLLEGIGMGVARVGLTRDHGCVRIFLGWR